MKTVSSKTENNTSQVTFTDTSEEVIENLKYAAKKGLRKCGKLITTQLKNEIKDHAHTGKFINHVSSWAKVDYKTGIPELQVGFYSGKIVKNKKHKEASHQSPWWMEKGTKSHTIKKKKSKLFKPNILGWDGHWYKSPVQHPGLKGQHLLRNTVYDNIDNIASQLQETVKVLNEEISNIPDDIYTDEEID